MRVTDCPCGSGRTLDACCGPFLDGEPAPTAEALMRSRYAAFVTANEDHLFRTWHPRTRPEPPYITSGIQWLELTVLEVVGGGPTDDHGIVEFEARWCDPERGRESVMRERSSFTRRAGRWMYVEGL